MYAASAEARKPTAPATSAGLAFRPNGTIARSCSTRCSPRLAIISVSTTPGRDHVDRDAPAAHLTRQGAGQADQAGLGRAVVDLARGPQEGDHRGHEHDAAPVRPHHGPEPTAHHPVDTRQVGVEDLVPRLLAHAQQEHVLGDPGVGDEDLDGAEGLLHGRERRLDLLGPPDVARHGKEVRRVRDRLPGQLRGRRGAVRDGHPVAERLEVAGTGQTDAA